MSKPVTTVWRSPESPRGLQLRALYHRQGRTLTRSAAVAPWLGGDAVLCLPLCTVALPRPPGATFPQSPPTRAPPGAEIHHTCLVARTGGRDGGRLRPYPYAHGPLQGCHSPPWPRGAAHGRPIFWGRFLLALLLSRFDH